MAETSGICYHCGRPVRVVDGAAVPCQPCTVKVMGLLYQSLRTVTFNTNRPYPNG